jgi:hypothetical protein
LELKSFFAVSRFNQKVFENPLCGALTVPDCWICYLKIREAYLRFFVAYIRLQIASLKRRAKPSLLWNRSTKQEANQLSSWAEDCDAKIEETRLAYEKKLFHLPKAELSLEMKFHQLAASLGQSKFENHVADIAPPNWLARLKSRIFHRREKQFDLEISLYRSLLNHYVLDYKEFLYPKIPATLICHEEKLSQ